MKTFLAATAIILAIAAPAAAQTPSDNSSGVHDSRDQGSAPSGTQTGNDAGIQLDGSTTQSTAPAGDVPAQTGSGTSSENSSENGNAAVGGRSN